MSTMHGEYYREVFRVEHEQRLRAAERSRLAASVRTATPMRRRLGEAVIRIGVLVRGPVSQPTQMLASAHRGVIGR